MDMQKIQKAFVGRNLISRNVSVSSYPFFYQLETQKWKRFGNTPLHKKCLANTEATIGTSTDPIPPNHGSNIRKDITPRSIEHESVNRCLK